MRRPLLALLALFLLALGVIALRTEAADAADKYPVSYNFLSSAVLAGTSMNADPPGANNWQCKPTARHPRPVVLVHGTFGNKNTNWQTYAPLLANEGYCVFALTYGVAPGTPPGPDQFGGLDEIEKGAAALKTFVAKVRSATGAKQVDLVGHSQGTLMPNYWLKFLGGAPYVKNYVSLAPLWHGTNTGQSSQVRQATAVFGQNQSSASTPGCKACSQMSSDSEFMKKMRAGGVRVKGVTYTNIVTKYDELVTPYTSGIEPGMKNVVLQDYCSQDYTEHFEIASDPVAAGFALNALDPAHPRPVPCTLVLPFEGPPPGTYNG